MTTSPIAIYKFNEIPFKIATLFFRVLDGKILNFIWKTTTKKPRLVKTILNNKRTSGDITILDFKLYDKAMIIKTAWYW